jgi:hypothetical protein
MRKIAIAAGLIAGALLGGILCAGPAAAEPGPTILTCGHIPDEHDPNVIKKVYAVGVRLHVSGKVMLAGFEVGWVESHMNNLNCGDRDSLGVFQQRPSAGWGTPAQIMNVDYAATQFFTRAIAAERAEPTEEAWEVGQDVQISCCPLRYRDAKAKAYQLIAEAAPSETRHGGDGTDIDGDGRADLLGVKPDGALMYYRNGGTAGTVPDPFNGSGASVGSGFNVFDWVDGADFSGDGSGDLLARKTDGTLLYYPNNRSHNPGGAPFAGPGVQIGHGWGAFSAIDAGDIDGDGRADLLALKPDGALLYYRNDGTADGDPFNGSGVQIGSGFNAFDWIDAADISGDSSADLLARKPDGTLWYYGNNRSHNPGGVPFAGSGTQIGHGFEGFDVLNAADLSGDGSADLMARKPDGTLWYFPNNRYSNPDGLPFVGAAAQIGHGFQTFAKLT